MGTSLNDNIDAWVDRGEVDSKEAEELVKLWIQEAEGVINKIRELACIYNEIEPDATKALEGFLNTAQNMDATKIIENPEQFQQMRKKVDYLMEYINYVLAFHQNSY